MCAFVKQPTWMCMLWHPRLLQQASAHATYHVSVPGQGCVLGVWSVAVDCSSVLCMVSAVLCLRSHPSWQATLVTAP